MVVRIVRMHFKKENVEAFLHLFNSNRNAIGSVEGCTHLELLQDADHPESFATISHWNDIRYLQQYRESELFKNVWRNVKVLFSKPAEAFTLKNY
jgi:quinol monooxygenase YgiN